MRAPAVTVVIATRDRCAALERTLRELHRDAAPPPIVVADNGSRDGTARLLATAFPHVRHLALGRNLGAVARNHGVAAAATPYVAFADDDSWWAPGALAAAARHLDAAPRLALVAARTLVGPAGRPDPVSRFMASGPLGTAPGLPGPSVLGFLACAAIVRRDAFLACGGFDPVVFFMGEEARVALDLRSAGHALAYCADVVAHHDPRPDPAAEAAKRLLALRNAALTAWMRRPLPVALAATRAVAAADRAALGSLLARLPRALARRRAVPREVEAEPARLAAAQRAYESGRLTPGRPAGAG